MATFVASFYVTDYITVTGTSTAGRTGINREREGTVLDQRQATVRHRRFIRTGCVAGRSVQVPIEKCDFSRLGNGRKERRQVQTRIVVSRDARRHITTSRSCPSQQDWPSTTPKPTTVTVANRPPRRKRNMNIYKY